MHVLNRVHLGFPFPPLFYVKIKFYDAWGRLSKFSFFFFLEKQVVPVSPRLPLMKNAPLSMRFFFLQTVSEAPTKAKKETKEGQNQGSDP